MGLSIAKMPVPLREEPTGTYRIGKSRVTLDVMINAYKMGDSAEQIVESFSSLKLSEVYLVIAFYLQNKEAVEVYLKEGEEQAANWQQHFEQEFPNAEFRKKLRKMKESYLAEKSPT